MADREAPGALRRALSPACVRRSSAVALVVGTLLNAINQGDVLLGGGEPSMVKLALTYLVPFAVSTEVLLAAISSPWRRQASRPAGIGRKRRAAASLVLEYALHVLRPRS